MEMPPCKAQEKWISTQSVDLGRSVRPPRPGGGFLHPTPLRWTPVLHILEREFRNGGAEPLFWPSRSKTSHPKGVSLSGGYLGYFVSGFMVLGFPLMFLRKIIEIEFQKCEAQPAFLPSFASPRGISWMGFMVLGFVVFLPILESELQKCGA